MSRYGREHLSGDPEKKNEPKKIVIRGYQDLERAIRGPLSGEVAFLGRLMGNIQLFQGMGPLSDQIEISAESLSSLVKILIPEKSREVVNSIRKKQRIKLLKLMRGIIYPHTR